MISPLANRTALYKDTDILSHAFPIEQPSQPSKRLMPIHMSYRQLSMIYAKDLVLQACRYYHTHPVLDLIIHITFLSSI
jgi:hypothetical protein